MAAEMENNSGSSLLLVAAFVVIAAVLAGAGWMIAQQQIYTNHALTSHANESWNAVSINQAFETGKCIPQQYTCPGTNKIMRWCELSRPAGDTRKPIAIGLVIGMVGQTEHIISGFASSVQNWSNPDKRCR